MTTQPEALRLADDLQSGHFEMAMFAAEELRRLCAVNEELLDLMQRAIRRLEIEHAHGGSIMREWITEARAAIAKAGEAK